MRLEKDVVPLKGARDGEVGRDYPWFSLTSSPL